MPQGLVLTLDWLKEHGVSCKLAWWYEKSRWLERVGNEAYKKYGDEVSWVGALSALQNQLHLPLHIGAKNGARVIRTSALYTYAGDKTRCSFS